MFYFVVFNLVFLYTLQPKNVALYYKIANMVPPWEINVIILNCVHVYFGISEHVINN